MEPRILPSEPRFRPSLASTAAWRPSGHWRRSAPRRPRRALRRAHHRRRVRAARAARRPRAGRRRLATRPRAGGAPMRRRPFLAIAVAALAALVPGAAALAQPAGGAEAWKLPHFDSCEPGGGLEAGPGAQEDAAPLPFAPGDGVTQEQLP